MSFGQFPDLSLANARAERDAARELLAKNIDLKEHREDVNRKKELNIATHCSI